MQFKADTYINIHSHRKPQLSNEFIIRNAYLKLNLEKINQLPYMVSVGLHPWNLHQMTVNECADKLIELATHEKVLAIGEIGLDKLINTPLTTQLHYFEAQLNIARALQKPVILHAVKSLNEFIPYLKKGTVPFVFHHFLGNAQQAKELLKFNTVYLSFGKNVWNEKTIQTIKEVPLNRIFLETDTTSTTTINQVYEQVSSIKEVSLEEIQKEIQLNFQQVFKI